VWDSYFTYSIRKWIPFNSENHEKYLQIDGLKERIEFMEKILIGNVLSFAKGVGIHFQQQLSCSILNVESKGTVTFKQISFETFDAFFKVNVSLPNFVGLGKGVSHGFGIVTNMK
jgi:hypothetical protein